MRNTLLMVSLMAGLGFSCAASAAGVPVSSTALQKAATAASPVQQAQYAEYRTRRGHLVKC